MGQKYIIYRIFPQIPQIFADGIRINENTYLYSKRILRNMKKLLYLLFVLLVSSCSTNQESQTLKDIQTSYMETSRFSKEISQKYFNMIENEWMLNRHKVDSYYKQALKVDSFATGFYNYVGTITNEHYQNEIDNTNNHQFTYADLIKKYRQVSDSINKHSYYDRDDNVKQIIPNSTLPKDIPNEKVFLYATLMQNNIAMGTTKSFISIFKQLSGDYTWGSLTKPIITKEQANTSTNTYSFSVESEYIAKLNAERRFTHIDSIYYNNKPIKLDAQITPIYELAEIKMDSLNAGHYTIYGGVKVYSRLGRDRYYPFEHQMKIAK